MKNISKIVLLLCGAYVLGKATKKEYDKSSPIDTNPNRIKLVSLSYRELGDPGAYFIRCEFENGDMWESEFILDNPDDFTNVYIKQAELDGAKIINLLEDY